MVASMDRWVGKVAVVTGVSAGIGTAIATKLVEEGLVVVGLARRLERMEELRKTILSKKGTFHPVQCDVSKESDILRAFEYANKLGPIHVLINNAGIASNGYLTDQPTEIWQKILAVNVVGLCIATREAVNDMKKNKVSGHIIHINSITGHYVPNSPGVNVYSASKHAVTALAETLRKEINASKLKIRITSISPGIVETEICEASGHELAEEVARLQPEDIAEGVIYALSAPPHVNVTELTIRPVNEEI